MDLNHRPLGYEPNRTQLSGSDFIDAARVEVRKTALENPSFGAKLEPDSSGLPGELPQQFSRLESHMIAGWAPACPRRAMRVSIVAFRPLTTQLIAFFWG